MLTKQNLMDTNPEVTVKFFLEYVKIMALNADNLEKHKRRLSMAVAQVQDYAQCFKLIDLDKKGIIYPKVLQSFLIKHKYYVNPTAITRFYQKYSHQKSYLTYEDILQALLPHQDYILVRATVSNISHQVNTPAKFAHSCTTERVKIIEHFTSFVLHSQIECLNQDYVWMSRVTRNSQRIGGILWRLLDRDHNNQLNFEKVNCSGLQMGVQISQAQWACFLYWHFHSYKQTINRDDFMRMLDIQQSRKRASSACRIDQYKIEQGIFRRAEEERLRNRRIEQAVRQKLSMMPHLTTANYRTVVQEEHFPYEYLNHKKELKGKLGYRNPQGLIKYSVERNA